MEAILRIVLGVLAVVGAFGFIIFIHELGHFLTARSVGIRCPFFAIGFGPRLFSFRWRATEFSVRLFPIGGYVMMTGEEPEATGVETWHDKIFRCLGNCSLPLDQDQLLRFLESNKERIFESGVLEAHYQEVHEHVTWLNPKTYETLEEVEGNFNHRTIPQRMLVISGGVLMNFLATIVLLAFVGFVYGKGDILHDRIPRVSQAFENTPAQEVGLAEWDKILAIEGKTLLSGSDLIETVAPLAGRAVEMSYLPFGQDEAKTVTLTPELLVGGVVFRGAPPTVSRADDDSPIQVGQVVTAVNGRPVSDTQALSEACREVLEKKETLEVQLEGQSDSIALEAEEARGILGVELGSVATVHIESQATNEVVSVEPGSLADQLGLRAGDEILFVNGAIVAPGASLLDSSFSVLATRPEPIDYELVVRREGETKTLEGQGPSVSADTFGATFHPIDAAVILQAPFQWIAFSVVVPVRMFYDWAKGGIKGKDIAKGVQGPLGIMHVIYELSDNGLAQFLFFLALLNALVGGFNLLPFPALDGSRLLLLLVAGVLGREFDPDKEARFHFTGLIVLLTVVIFVSVLDVQRLLSGRLPIE